MILTVDIGNTNIKVGAWDGDRLVFVSRLHTNTLRTRDEYAIRLLEIFRLNECNNTQFDGAMISSVVPPLSTVLLQAVEYVIQSDRVYLVSPDLVMDLEICIDNPQSLGSDLICAGVAVADQMPLPCIAITLGTATTIFVVDGKRRFLGAAYSPGVGISLNALSKQAAQLPFISLDSPGSILGTNTVDSMKSGIIYGTARMLDGMVGQIREELGGEASVVASGGLASQIVGYCREEMLVDDDLVLKGLKVVFHKNAR